MLDELIKQGEIFREFIKSQELFPDYIDHDDFENWKRKALMFLQINYKDNLQTSDFAELRNSNSVYDYEKMIAILRAFREFAQ